MGGCKRSKRNDIYKGEISGKRLLQGKEQKRTLEYLLETSQTHHFGAIAGVSTMGSYMSSKWTLPGHLGTTQCNGKSDRYNRTDRIHQSRMEHDQGTQGGNSVKRRREKGERDWNGTGKKKIRKNLFIYISTPYIFLFTFYHIISYYSLSSIMYYISYLIMNEGVFTEYLNPNQGKHPNLS